MQSVSNRTSPTTTTPAEQRKWIHSLLYFTLIVAFIHLLHTFIISSHIFSTTVKLKKQSHLPLRFSSDGTFKILQVADMHYGNGMMSRCKDMVKNEFENCSDLNSTLFLRRMIDSEKPDFVAFTGDNIFGPSAIDAAESLFGAFGPVMESELPWAAVLGNHDQESTMTREELMSFISLMDYSLSQTFPSAEDSPGKEYPAPPMAEIDGFGNYNLRVSGPPGSDLANNSVLNLYFLDSGDIDTVNGLRTYGWIKESQLNWLHRIPRNAKGQKCADDQSTANLPPPALTFFHIPIPEIRQRPIREMIGEYQEYVACSFMNSGVLKNFITMGDVKAAFIGHDHNNDFCGNLDGVWFCYGGGFGYHGYGKAGWPRRARVILATLGKGEKSWTGVESIKTWKRLDDEKLTKIDEQVLWIHDRPR